jgi:RES domain-containing protein
MSLWYRVSKKQWREQAFSGEGGLYTNGRWNPKGVRVVYSSSSISLAALEWLSHQGVKTISTAWVKLSIEVPDHEIIKYDAKSLPVGWNKIPDSNISKDFANEVLFKPNRLAIAVPSVVIPEEWNLILNPSHPLMPGLKTVDLGENSFHSRLG